MVHIPLPSDIDTLRSPKKEPRKNIRFFSFPTHLTILFISYVYVYIKEECLSTSSKFVPRETLRFFMAVICLFHLNIFIIMLYNDGDSGFWSRVNALKLNIEWCDNIQVIQYIHIVANLCLKIAQDDVIIIINRDFHRRRTQDMNKQVCFLHSQYWCFVYQKMIANAPIIL